MEETSEAMKIDAALTERLQDYAKERSVSLQDAFETALGLGLEVCASESVRLEGRVAPYNDTVIAYGRERRELFRTTGEEPLHERPAQHAKPT